MNYEQIYDAARRHHGSAVEEGLPKALSAKQLRSVGADRHLSRMSQCVFQAGFSWAVVEKKWPGFEKAFAGFEPTVIAAWPEEQLERLASDASIIRNLTKIRSVLENARMILDAEHTHGSYSQMIADWPAEDTVGLWQWLKRHGSRLGGNSGPMYLRYIGKDTFILTQDVVAALKRDGAFDGNPTTKGNLARIQNAFNELQEQSGRSLCELSRILSRSIG